MLSEMKTKNNKKKMIFTMFCCVAPSVPVRPLVLQTASRLVALRADLVCGEHTASADQLGGHGRALTQLRTECTGNMASLWPLSIIDACRPDCRCLPLATQILTLRLLSASCLKARIRRPKQNCPMRL